MDKILIGRIIEVNLLNLDNQIYDMICTNYHETSMLQRSGHRVD